jgi:formylglycine-generating enzyme required for sulfatase activity
MHRLLSAFRTSLLATLAATAAAQVTTGRTMILLAPPVLGQTASFQIASPASAAGNFYAIFWCAPPHAGTATIFVPGFTILGPVLVDPQRSVPAFTGLLGAAGSVVHGVVIPSVPSLIGYAWDLQSADLEASTRTVSFADNELALTISGNVLPNMMPIPAGTFLMGSNAASGTPYFGQTWEQSVHQVTISRAFWMGKYEVTQAEYQAVMGANPSYFQGPSRPVETVSWNDAVTYCTALTVQEAAANRLPFGYEYRLPTEAEWEYCCRAGTTTEFHYGPTLLCGQANFYFSDHTSSSCGSNGTVAAGSYVPNVWGLFDMHGDVWEWCLDGWDGAANYPPSPVVDPYVQSGPYRVCRGGGWGSNSYACRSAHRNRDVPGSQTNYIGFRVVLAPILP